MFFLCIVPPNTSITLDNNKRQTEAGHEVRFEVGAEKRRLPFIAATSEPTTAADATADACIEMKRLKYVQQIVIKSK